VRPGGATPPQVCLHSGSQGGLGGVGCSYPWSWQDAAREVLRVRPSGRLPAASGAQVSAARDMVCADLGWHTRDGEVVRLESLTVSLATQSQSLDALSAIADRHAAFRQRVLSLDALQPVAGELPEVSWVLRRWRKL
jgi:hypothetical protein